MICLLKIENGEIKGWIIASDIHEARRKAQSAMQNELAAMLYRIEFPPKGKTVLPDGTIMLVD